MNARRQLRISAIAGTPKVNMGRKQGMSSTISPNVRRWSCFLLCLSLWGCRYEAADTGDTSGDSFTFTETEQSLISRYVVEPPDLDSTNGVVDRADAAHFGQFVFFDTRFSGSGSVSCATCHDPDLGFADGLVLSEAAGVTERHAPSVLNTVYNTWFYWDGRADTHWSQALSPIEDVDEQNFTRLEVAHLLVADVELSAAYAGVFGALPDLSDGERFPDFGRPDLEDPSSESAQNWASMADEDQVLINTIFVNVGKAIAAYEAKLIDVSSPFDALVSAVVSGDSSGGDALSLSAKRGLRIFLGKGQCNLCHFGPMLTNGAFHNIGLGHRDYLQAADLGRYSGIDAVQDNPFNGASIYSDDPTTGAHKLDYLAQGDEHLAAFKVPSLRNVAKTAPYMHGGHFESLTRVVEYYDALDEVSTVGHREESLLPLGLTQDEIADVVSFLESLTSDSLDPQLTIQPDSPSLDSR